MSRCTLLFLLLAAAAPAQESDDGFPLPPGAVRRFGSRQMRFPDYHAACVASPDGKLLATAGDSGVVVWDLQTLKAKRVLNVRFTDVPGADRGTNLAFLPDSSALLVGVCPAEFDGRMTAGEEIDVAEVWDIATGKRRFALRDRPLRVTAAFLTAGGKEITVVNGGRVRFFDARDGSALRAVETPRFLGPVWASADGRTVAIEGRPLKDGIAVLNTADGKEFVRLPDKDVSQIALGADGRLLAYMDGKTVHVRDLKAGKDLSAIPYPRGWIPPEIQSLSPPGRVVMRLAADGKSVFFGNTDGKQLRWDLGSNKVTPDAEPQAISGLTGFAASPDDSILYLIDSDHVIRRWDRKAGKELPVPPGYKAWVAFAPAADGKHLFVGDMYGQLDEWDLGTGKKSRELRREGDPGISTLAASPDGKWLAVGRSYKGVELWDVSTGKVVHKLTPPKQPDSNRAGIMANVAFAADGSVVYFQSEAGDLTAWEVATRKRLWQVAGEGARLAVDPKGRWLATCAYLFGRTPHSWFLVDARTGGLAAQVKGEWIVEDVVFTPDGSCILTADGGGVHVFDAESRRKIRTLPAGGIGPARLACSPDSKWLAVGRDPDGTGAITVWELASAGLLATFPESHAELLSPPAFTRDGRGLITNPGLSPVLWDLCPKDLPTAGLWEKLADADPAKAFQAQWALVKNPPAAVKLLGEKVKPAELAVQRKQFDQWVTDLDAPRFPVREAAEKELTANGVVPLGWLRKALTAAKSDEVRTRLTRILVSREKEPGADAHRLSRATQVLELAGTAEAKELLKTWATDGSPVGDEAQASLGRLSKQLRRRRSRRASRSP